MLLGCDTNKNIKELARPSRSARYTKVELPNVLIIPSFIFESIASVECTTFTKACLLGKEALAKLNRIEQMKTAPSDKEGSGETNLVEPNTPESVKFILILQWLLAASKANDSILPSLSCQRHVSFQRNGRKKFKRNVSLRHSVKHSTMRVEATVASTLKTAKH